MASDPQLRLTSAQQQLEKILDRATSTLITFAGTEIPNFGNWTPQALVDEAAILGAAKRRAEQAEKTLKEVLKTKLEGKTELRGDLYEMTLTTSNVSRLNQDRAKAKLVELGGQAALDECMDNNDQDTMRFKSLS